jgi:hypothetical protein
VGLLLSLADGIKSAFVRYSSVVPGVTFFVQLLFIFGFGFAIG